MSGKTLRQLWDENNCRPFWAQSDDAFFYMQGLSLDSLTAVGSGVFGGGGVWKADYSAWTLCDDPRKPVPKPKEKLVLWRRKSTLGIQREVGELVLLTEEEFIKRFDRVADTWERVRLSDLLEGSE
jgi:hypothetical protein